MAFYACDFKLDGFAASDLGLEAYSFGSNGQEDASTFTASGEVVGDIVGDTMLLYGTSVKETLSPTLVFGVNTPRLDCQEWLTRYEISKITEWMTGDGTWRWLTIRQGDMKEYRYKVVLSSLKLLHDGGMPYAFEAVFTADSPYAYTHPYNFTWSAGDLLFNNISTNMKYFRPTFVIHRQSGDVKIVNHSDGDREFAFSSLPATVRDIYVDNKNQIIKDLANGLNLYEYFNYNFFRAVKGINKLTIEGDCTIDVRCEFPVNIGV